MDIKTIIKNSAIWIIIIGSISWGVAMLTGSLTPSFINVHVIDYGNGVQTTLYSFDIVKYLKTIQTSVSVPVNKMFYDPPTFPKITWDNILKSIPNLFIFLINELVWWFNIILFVPLKLLLTPIMLYLSLIGINLQGYGIITFIYKIYTITPPIIKYI